MKRRASDRESSGELDSQIERRPPILSRRAWFIVVGTAIVLAVGVLASALSLKAAASDIQSQLNTAASLVPSLRADILAGRTKEAQVSVSQIREKTTSAREITEQPLWILSSAVPYLGGNFGAVSEVAHSADDVARHGLVPLVDVAGSLDWASLLPGSSSANLEPMAASAPSISSAAYAVRGSADRLNAIKTQDLIPQVAESISLARDHLNQASAALDSAADAAELGPAMLGADVSRRYLLIVQNNAELRSSGGIPGALAVIEVTSGRMKLASQVSATDLGPMQPVLPLEAEQQRIYSSRMGKFMQDVNLTPDFPTAAANAKAMWESKTGQRLDGVMSIDPIALSYILENAGPITIDSPDTAAAAAVGLPTSLDQHNVVQTLLSDVYAKIQQPKLQDAYFAAVAQEVFAFVSQGAPKPEALLSAISRGVDEGRVLLWSSSSQEQSVISKYKFSGSVAGPGNPPVEFGVYFNDGTGAKMDYYVKRTVQLVKECSNNGYEETTVRVTSSNTAPANAAATLPPYVTGAGVYGVPAGYVQTNISAYGPAQAYVETAKLNGQRTDFAPYKHSGRPVGVLAVRLAPGETTIVEFTFSKIVQHAEPTLVVTPTVQPVKDVALPTESAECRQDTSSVG